MKEGQRLWTRKELILTINLYYKTPFGRMHSSNPDIVHLSRLIGRTPGSIAYKLVNFASLDPSLKARGIKGAANASTLDKAIWAEFYNNISTLAYESEKLLAGLEHTTIENLNNIDSEAFSQVGKTREAIVKIRVNQSFFRKSILAAYNNTCCITGLQMPALLIASHIVPWSEDEINRLNPRNGIAINPLHDKAFEAGLLTITSDYLIKISPILKKEANSSVNADLFTKYHGSKIFLPTKFLPDPTFLALHNLKFRG